MSDEVNCAVYSLQLHHQYGHSRALHSIQNHQKPGKNITRLQAPATWGQGWHQPEQIFYGVWWWRNPRIPGYWQQNNIQPQLVAGAVLRLALGKWGVHVHTPLLYRTSLAHSLLTGYDTTYMLIYSFHSVCLWFSATLCSQDATSGDTSPLYRVTITVPIRPIMNWGWQAHGWHGVAPAHGWFINNTNISTW